MATQARHESHTPESQLQLMMITDDAIPCLLLAYPKANITAELLAQHATFLRKYPFQPVQRRSPLLSMAPRIAASAVDDLVKPLAIAFPSHRRAMAFARRINPGPFSDLFVGGVQLVSLVVDSTISDGTKTTVLLAIGRDQLPTVWPTSDNSFVDKNTPRKRDGTKVTIPPAGAAGNTTAAYVEYSEDGGSAITISAVRDSSLWSSNAIQYGLQDGGNGSGGGDASGAYRMHTIQGASQLVFWKRDVLSSAVTPQSPDLSSDDVVEKLNNGNTPNFARIFANLTDAQTFYTLHRREVDLLAKTGDVVFVNALAVGPIPVPPARGPDI